MELPESCLPDPLFKYETPLRDLPDHFFASCKISHVNANRAAICSTPLPSRPALRYFDPAWLQVNHKKIAVTPNDQNFTVSERLMRLFGDWRKLRLFISSLDVERVVGTDKIVGVLDGEEFMMRNRQEYENYIVLPTEEKVVPEPKIEEDEEHEEDIEAPIKGAKELEKSAAVKQHQAMDLLMLEQANLYARQGLRYRRLREFHKETETLFWRGLVIVNILLQRSVTPEAKLGSAVAHDANVRRYVENLAVLLSKHYMRMQMILRQVVFIRPDHEINLRLAASVDNVLQQAIKEKKLTLLHRLIDSKTTSSSAVHFAQRTKKGNHGTLPTETIDSIKLQMEQKKQALTVEHLFKIERKVAKQRKQDALHHEGAATEAAELTTGPGAAAAAAPAAF